MGLLSKDTYVLSFPAFFIPGRLEVKGFDSLYERFFFLEWLLVFHRVCMCGGVILWLAAAWQFRTVYFKITADMSALVLPIIPLYDLVLYIASVVRLNCKTHGKTVGKRIVWMKLIPFVKKKNKNEKGKGERSEIKWKK